MEGMGQLIGGYAGETAGTRNSPFDRIESAVLYLREVEAQAEKLAAHLVGNDLKQNAIASKTDGSVAVVPHLLRRLDTSTDDVRAIAERISHQLSRIADRL